jgi:hypothetical protein
MAIGLPAYHEERTRYDGCTDGELMNAIEIALRRLKWNGQQTERWAWSGYTGFSFFSWGERIRVVVRGEGRVLVRSECALPTQWIDWGRNEANVERFLRALDRALDAVADGWDED